MSLFNDASLVMIPSGYKTSKVYSVKPDTGAGDLTFTRTGDTASRIGPNGLIEKVRTNLFLQSNGFDTASWSKSGATVTANQPDPFGGNNAFLVQFSGATTDTISQLVSMVSGTPYTLSVWIKGVDLTGLRVAIGANLVIVTSQVINGTWVRVSATQTVGSTGSLTNQIRAENSLGQSFYIYAAQLETGDIATDYIATTTAAVAVGPVANVPRLDYLNSSCPRLILEGQRTNVALFSEQFDNAVWNKDAVTATANAVTSPDGYQNADAIVENSSNDDHRILLNAGFSGTASTAYSFSVYVKKIAGQPTRHIYWMCQQGASAVYAHYNMDTFSVHQVSQSGTGSGATASITAVGNDWYRLSLSGIVSTTTGTYFNQFYFETTPRTGFVAETYTGNGTSGFYLYGWQIEAGAYATSYIPTLGAAVTRGVDAASKTGISSLIGQTEGTLFVDFDHYQLATAGFLRNFVLAPTGSDAANRVSIIPFTNANNKFFLTIRYASTNIEYQATTPSGNLKIAIGYKSGDSVIYINGSQVFSSSTSFAFTETLNRFAMDSSDKVNQTLLFPTRLTNSQLAELTTI